MQQGAPVAGNFLRAAFSFIPGADFLQQRPGDAFRGVFWAERAGIMGNVPLQAVQQGRKARTNDGSPGAERFRGGDVRSLGPGGAEADSGLGVFFLQLRVGQVAGQADAGAEVFRKIAVPFPEEGRDVPVDFRFPVRCAGQGLFQRGHQQEGAFVEKVVPAAHGHDDVAFLPGIAAGGGNGVGNEGQFPDDGFSVEPFPVLNGFDGCRHGEGYHVPLVQVFSSSPAGQVPGVLFQQAQQEKSGAPDFSAGEDVPGPHVFRDGEPVLPRKKQSGGIHVHHQEDARVMDGPGDGKIFARAPGVQDQSVNAQGFPPGGVFQVGVLRADEVGVVPLLDGRGHDGPAFQADPLEGFAESPGITGKEGVVPFEGNGSAGVPFHDAAMLGD